MALCFALNAAAFCVSDKLKEGRMKTVVSAVTLTMVCTAALSQDIADGFAGVADDAFDLVGGSVAVGVAQVSQEAEFDAFGPSLKFGLAGRVGKVAESPLYLQWAGYFARAYSHTSNTERQGSAPLLFTSSTSPSGTIDLSTIFNGNGSTSDASVAITDSTGDTASIVSSAFSPLAEGTAVSQFAVSPTGAGGIFTALTTNGETGLGSAYGAVFDDTGFLFLGVGDNSQSTVTTAIDEKISAANHTVFLSAGFPLNEKWNISPRIGPTYRGIERTTTSRKTIDINEGSALEATLPDVVMTEKISLNSKYYGAVIGADITQNFPENWLLSLGGEVGLVKFSARSNHLSALSVAGEYAEAREPVATMNGTATIARITSDLTHTTRNGTIFSLSASVNYLSDAPYVTSQEILNPALTGDGSNIGLTGAGETYRTHSIDSKSMISVGVSFGVVHFF